MTPRAVLISLAISCALAVWAVVLYLPELRGPGADSGPVLDLRLGDVQGLELVGPGEDRRTVSREGSDWMLVWPGEDSEEGPEGETVDRRWPVEGGNVRGAIRLLLENLERDGEGGGVVGSADRALAITTDGGAWRIEFGEARVGGHTPVRVVDPDGEEVAARLPTRVCDVFKSEGLMAWRSARALAIESGVDRVYIRSRDLAPIRLARMNGRWSLIEPIQARADDERCRDLLATFQRLRVAEFHDELDPTAEETGLAEPGAVLALERDVPSQPGVRVLTGAAVGSPTNLERTHVYVALEQRELLPDGSVRVVLGPVVASLAVEEANAIQPFAQAYLSRRTLEASIPDIRRLEIVRGGSAPEAFLRNVAGWTDGSSTAPGAMTSEALDDLLAVLAGQPATQVELARPEGWAELGLVEARDAEGASLGRVGLAVVERDGKPVALATQAGRIVRLYPAEAHLRLIAWLRKSY